MLFIAVSLLVIVGARTTNEAGAGIQEVMHVTEDNSALAHVSYLNGEITDCYIIGQRSTVDSLIGEKWQLINRVKNKEFTVIRNKCLTVQEAKLDEEIVSKAKEMSSDGKRTKRGIIERIPGFEIFSGIYPGTLWCGDGNIADVVKTQDGLGENKALDACCRTHDRCPVAMCGHCKKARLGNLYNSSPWARSDCGCDDTFRSCLHAVNDKHADIIGNIYFTILDQDCIEHDYPKTCVSYGWWRIRCTKYKRDTSKPKRYAFRDQPKY